MFSGKPVLIITSERNLQLNWQHVFATNKMIPIHYYITVGSTDGLCDITEGLSLTDTTRTFRIPQSTLVSENIQEVYISISAVYFTGMRTNYKTTFKF